MSALIDMRPDFAQDDPTDVRLGQSEISCDLALRFPSRLEAADAQDDIGGQLGVSVLLAASLAHEAESFGTSVVLSWGDVLKVRDAVVGLVTVDVVDLPPARGADECAGDELMDYGCGSCSSWSAQADHSIPTSLVLLQDSIGAGGATSIPQPLYASEVGDRVPPSPTDDLAPLFVHAGMELDFNSAVNQKRRKS